MLVPTNKFLRKGWRGTHLSQDNKLASTGLQLPYRASSIYNPVHPAPPQVFKPALTFVLLTLGAVIEGALLSKLRSRSGKSQQQERDQNNRRATSTVQSYIDTPVFVPIRSHTYRILPAEGSGSRLATSTFQVPGGPEVTVVWP